MHEAINKSWHGRFPAKEVIIGDIGLGGNNPVRTQSMTNTATHNTKETVEQCLRIIEAGADFVRISTPNIKSARNLAEIKKHIRAAGYNTPLIADIHYKPDVALIAARIAEKIRINPGNYCSAASFEKQTINEKNYTNELEVIHKNISPLLEICKEYGTAIRIGTNHGSLSPRILYRYGNTAEGMVQATLEYLKILEDFGFYKTVISLKSSSPAIMIEAYRQIACALIKRKHCYPLHLGVTEAGAQDEGRVRSAVGICSLLNDGIGDTIRVSLSEEPEKEIPFAKKIIKTYEKNNLSHKSEKPLFRESDKFKILSKIKNKLPNKPSEYPVVISTCIPESTISLKEKSKQHQKPDYVFCNEIVKTNSEKLILPYKLWKEQNSSDIYPLISISDISSTVNIKANTKFILVKTTDITKEELKSVCSVKDAVLVLETYLPTPTDTIIDFVKEVLSTCSMPVVLKTTTNISDREQLIIDLANLYGYLISEGVINGIWVDSKDNIKNNETALLSFSLLQATGKRITTNQYISCPTCARTSFNLQEVIEDVKKQTQHFKGLKIAIMGCVVNGPGEMADADYGLVGSGRGKIHLYKKQKIIKKNIEQKNAAKELAKLIAQNKNS